MWIFGYGSLIWRPDMAFEQSCTALLRDWQRRFYQASPDHRGTPEAPGRVVTLINDEWGDCWGKAYRIPPDDRPRILEALDLREQAGYEHHWLTLEVADETGTLTNQSIEALVYVAPPTNPNFLGPGPLRDMARHILNSHGPSGPNTEYLLELAKSLRNMEVHDHHVFALEAELLSLQAAS
jgi:cation transport regulator ChaC